MIANPNVPLATAVAASSAFPPFLSPLVLKFMNSDFVPDTGNIILESFWRLTVNELAESAVRVCLSRNELNARIVDHRVQLGCYKVR